MARVVMTVGFFVVISPIQYIQNFGQTITTMTSYHYVDRVSLFWEFFNSKIAPLSNKANIRFFLPVFEKDILHPI